jgi:hypothetical protein
MSDNDSVQSQQPAQQQPIERAIDTKGIQEGLHALVTNPVVQQVAGDVAGMIRDVTVGVVSVVVTNKLGNSNNNPAQAAQTTPSPQTPPPANTSSGAQESPEAK